MSKLSPEEALARVRAKFGDVVKAKPIREKEEEPEIDVTDLLTRVCYFYPQYDLESVEKLTYQQVEALLLQAEKQRAIELYNYTMVAAAPHTKKGSLVGKLVKQYRKIIDL